MSLDFIKEPAVFERAFGSVWGFRIWRGLIVIGIGIFLGGAVFGVFHGYAILRADFGRAGEKPVSSGIPVEVPSSKPGCIIERSTVNGKVIQTCQ